jgi:hypothetical protein
MGGYIAANQTIDCIGRYAPALSSTSLRRCLSLALASVRHLKQSGEERRVQQEARRC